MSNTSIKSTLAGFIGGVAFIIGCGGSGGGGGPTNSNGLLNNAIAAETQKVQDIEEMNCKISADGVTSASGNIGSAVNGYYESGSIESYTQTYAERFPNHIVYCATLGASSYTEYTLASLEQGNWKTYSDSTGGYGRRSKVWRAVLR